MIFGIGNRPVSSYPFAGVLAGTEYSDFSADMGLAGTAAGDSTAEGAFSAALVLAQLFTTGAIVEEPLVAAITAGYTVSGGLDAEASMAGGVRMANTASADATAEAAKTAPALFAGTVTDEVIASGDFESAFTVGLDLATQIVAEAATEAGLVVSQVVNVRFAGVVVSGEVVTPSRRTYQVSVEVRGLSIDSDDRTFTVN